MTLGRIVAVSAAILALCAASASAFSVCNGCPANGECFGVNDEFQDGCFTYTCEDRGFYQNWRFTKGGCRYNQGCVELGYKTTGCNVQTCTKKEVDHNGQTVYQYGMTSEQPRCSRNGKCYEVGEKAQDEGSCFQYTCVEDNGYPYMKLTYGGCRYNGECVELGYKTTGCNVQTCTKKEVDHNGQTVYQYGMTSDQPRCSRNGKCYEVGEKVQDEGSCFQYTCVENNGYPYMKLTYGGCRYNGRCVDVGDKTGGCHIQTCSKRLVRRNGHDVSLYELKTEQLKCRRYDGNGCAENGESYEDAKFGTCKCTVSGYSWSMNCNSR